MLTWPLASTAIVVLTLALCLGWYERSRPAPRLVALVATMAALAIIGRIAFAPIPNVKPTTDLILLAGLAFGAVPGFAVGSTTALVSNLFFGQGLHTPWQMLAWGGVGVLGALAARLLGPQPGRFPLAVLCALAGLAFGAFMDLSVWATVGGQHTLAEYWVISVRSLPFNIAHAAGNAAFAVAFAPVVLAALARARARAQVTVHPLSPAAAAVAGPQPASALHGARGGGIAAALLALLLVGGLAMPARSEAAKRPVDYLLAHQTPNGGFGEGGSADTLASGWAAMALGATPGVPSSARRSAATYLRTTAKGTTDPGDLERIILGLRALGEPARDAGGRDLGQTLLAQQASDGSFAGLVNQTAFALLALRAAGHSRSAKPVKRAAAYLLDHANADGGFSYSGKGASGTDDTAGVVQALVAAGRGGAKVTKSAVAYLEGKQLSDGGFPIGADTRSNAQSTAWAVQALVAAGKDPRKVRSGGRTPIQFLKSLIVADGHVRYSRTSDQTPVWATAQAQLALVGSPLPVNRAKVAAADQAVAARHASAVARRKARKARRARKLARREAHRRELAKTFSTSVLAPAAGGILLLSAFFGLR